MLAVYFGISSRNEDIIKEHVILHKMIAKWKCRLACKELRALKGMVFAFKRTLFGEEEGGL